MVAKTLSVALVAALGCRSSNIALSTGCRNYECLRWQHIGLHCEGEAAYHNLRATTTLEFENGHKDALNEESIHYLRPVEDVDCRL